MDTQCLYAFLRICKLSTCKIQSTYLSSVAFSYFFLHQGNLYTLFFLGDLKRHKLTALVGIILLLPHIIVFGIFSQPLPTDTVGRKWYGQWEMYLVVLEPMN